MAKKNNKKKTIDPEREMAFKSLPINIRNNLSEEEIEMFLNDEVWSEELFSKLREFIKSV